ncbi:MAG: hypothetical protein KatS3mg115_2254 [Candidatus Poribacteria bacterium]|nr:MAG: hypothetical protein KatS3mg115_2254 [Candidatus Poribacteria bacterium]
MFDAHSALPIPFVVQFASQLEPSALLFLEEPWLPGNIEAMRKVRESVRVPLATGERDPNHLGGPRDSRSAGD